MYSRPSASHTRYPCARVMRVGSLPSRPSPAAAPNSASGRLLPVDVNPGTRQSLTVFHHLDRHRPHQLRFTLEVVKYGEKSEEHTSELQSRLHLVCRLLLEKRNKGQCHCT